MSKNETPLTLAYWEQLDEDAALVEDYPIRTGKRRHTDGVAIFGRPRKRLPKGQPVPLQGEDVAVIQ